MQKTPSKVLKSDSASVPEIVYGKLHHQNAVFKKGKFLGKGGFGKCYELIETKTGVVYAAKVISKSLLAKPSDRDKVIQEVKVHAKLKNINVVHMESHFEDSINVYFLLELCSHRSVMELMKRRLMLTEPEARYYTAQLVNGCEYLHSLRIIHRDLKLGNLFLTRDLQLKIGDFGLAVRADVPGPWERTLCGTPNYIAPEVLDRKGHSYPVDVWATGCVLFALLVGRPPFETETVKQTYAKIQRNDYAIPLRMSTDAGHLIKALLLPNPKDRPVMNAILRHPFFTNGYTPESLPHSCLVQAPRFDLREAAQPETPKKDTVFRTSQKSNAPSPTPAQKQTPSKKDLLSLGASAATEHAQAVAPLEYNVDTDYKEMLRSYTKLLDPFLHSLRSVDKMPVEDEDPASNPYYWISRWIDVAEHSGMAYTLCDNCIGVLFNDYSKMLWNVSGGTIQYMDTLDGKREIIFRDNEVPAGLGKKLKLLQLFRSYMCENLFPSGHTINRQSGKVVARLPYVELWLRTTAAISFLLSDGVLQVNFLEDHSKLIINAKMGAVTFINTRKECSTYQLKLLIETGCTHELKKRLKYARVLSERMLRPPRELVDKCAENAQVAMGGSLTTRVAQ